MEFTNQYKNGIIKLAILLGLLCFFIAVCKWYPSASSSFVLDVKAQCFIENQELVLAEAEKEKEKKYNYYVNSISDFTGYKLGLSVSQIDRLIAYREKGDRIYTIEQFKNVSKISDSKLESIKNVLVFPKKISKPFKKLAPKKESKRVISDLNKITSKELKYKLGFPWKMANRIINYREKIGGFKSMEELVNVYYITEEQLKILNKSCKIDKNKKD